MISYRIIMGVHFYSGNVDPAAFKSLKQVITEVGGDKTNASHYNKFKVNKAKGAAELVVFVNNQLKKGNTIKHIEKLSESAIRAGRKRQYDVIVELPSGKLEYHEIKAWNPLSREIKLKNGATKAVDGARYIADMMYLSLKGKTAKKIKGSDLKIDDLLAANNLDEISDLTKESGQFFDDLVENLNKLIDPNKKVIDPALFDNLEDARIWSFDARMSPDIKEDVVDNLADRIAEDSVIKALLVSTVNATNANSPIEKLDYAVAEVISLMLRVNQ